MGLLQSMDNRLMAVAIITCPVMWGSIRLMPRLVGQGAALAAVTRR